MKKICVVTAARSEYGLLKWLMHDIKESSDLLLQLIVTGGHLLTEQGYTIDEIIEDGFEISYIVDAKLDTSTQANIASGMGKMAQGFAEAFEKLQPDLLVVLGDRYELLPVCNTAFVMRIPIAHISGGDVTEGAIDDGIRNAITMLADYHFPGTKDAAENIIRMRGSDKNVWVVGEPGLDSFIRENLMSREELAEDLGLNVDKKWILMTYHAETKKGMEYNLDVVKNCVKCLIEQENIQVVATYANADFGGNEINQYLSECAKTYSKIIKVIPSLGHRRYLSFMKQATLVLGNSSSGITEAPFLNVPVVNVGDRQKGRHQCANIIQSETDKEGMGHAIDYALHVIINNAKDRFYWGNGHASERITVKLINI